jgi:acetylornithine deacetylase/succinyl-diaminopimelate desuccinylase-like protein
MTEKFPECLKAERLMDHMQFLCKEIGPRPPTSDQERRAAKYVSETLQGLGFEDIQKQVFKSQNSLGWILVISVLVAALAIPIAWLVGGQWGKLVGGLLLLGSAYTIRDFFLARPPIFQRLIARWTSQNVIARTIPTQAVKRRVYLIGHLDTNRQRFLAPPFKVELQKINGACLILVPALSGILLLMDIFLNRQGIDWWQWLICGLAFVTALALLSEERQPHIEGANDNATAVSVLLSIAEALSTQSLQHTEVTLLFTGCEEVVCVGIENYLKQFAPPKENTYWIDFEMVGTGNLCYITKHGAAYLGQYYPAPEMINLAEQAARKHPELGVKGKEMIILEEVANLRHRGYKAICVAGYNDEGHLPNWHRVTDTLENIEPDTLQRAACYAWTLLQEIDASPI